MATTRDLSLELDMAGKDRRMKKRNVIKIITRDKRYMYTSFMFLDLYIRYRYKHR